MRIFIDNQELIGFTEVSVSRSIDTFCGQFYIQVTATPGVEFPIKRRSKVEIKVGEVLILTGAVELISIDYSTTFHGITIQGRDNTRDVYDTTSDGTFEFNPPTDLKTIIESILSSNNINDVSVVTDVKDLDKFTEGDKVAGELGTGLFDIIESYCRLRQVIPVSNEEGNIVLLRTESPEDAGVSLRHEPGSNNNNILSARARYDDTQRFNKYNCFGQGNVSELNEVGDTSFDDIVSRGGSATDDFITDSRTYNFQSERAANNADLTQRAIWEANIRRARSASYTATVQGHEKTGKDDPWKLHQLVQVVDTFASVRATLLVNNLDFRFSLSKGSTTDIGLVVKDAYSLEAQQNAREARANLQGDDFD